MARWDTLAPRRRPTRATLLRALVGVFVALAGVVLVAHLRHGFSGSYAFTGPVDTVAVTVDSGSVDIVGTAGEGASVAIRAHSLVGSPSPTSQRVDHGLLRVVGVCPGGMVLDCRIDFHIEVPSTAFVEVITGSANVTVERMARSVRVTSTHGRIVLNELGGTSIEARTSTGTVTGSELAATQVAVAAKGDVGLVLTASPDTVSVKSLKGAIDISVPDAPYAVKTDSAVGIVTVEVSRNADARRSIDLTAPEGDIHVRRAT